MLFTLKPQFNDKEHKLEWEDKYLATGDLITICLVSLFGTFLKCHLALKHEDGTIAELYSVLTFKAVEMFLEFVYFDRNLNSPGEWKLSVFAFSIAVFDLIMFAVDAEIDLKLLTDVKETTDADYVAVSSEKTKSFKRFCHQEIKFGVLLANIAPFCIEIFKLSFYVVTGIQIIIDMRSNEFEMESFKNGLTVDMPEQGLTFDMDLLSILENPEIEAWSSDYTTNDFRSVLSSYGNCIQEEIKKFFIRLSVPGAILEMFLAHNLPPFPATMEEYMINAKYVVEIETYNFFNTTLISCVGTVKDSEDKCMEIGGFDMSFKDVFKYGSLVTDSLNETYRVICLKCRILGDAP